MIVKVVNGICEVYVFRIMQQHVYVFRINNTRGTDRSDIHAELERRDSERKPRLPCTVEAKLTPILSMKQ